MNSYRFSLSLCGLSALLVCLLTTAAATQGPPPPGPGKTRPGPGYYRTFPSETGDAALKELEGLESQRFEELLGPGPWTFGKRTSPFPYIPGPAEKNLLRLDPQTIKGPHIEMESPFCVWNIPCENDGDAAWLYEWATGAPHESLAEPPERSANLEKTLRMFRSYGAVVRGLRVAAVPQEDVIEQGSEPSVTLMLYNASGQPVEVDAATSLQFGAATARFEFGTPGEEANHIVLKPGQSLNASKVLHELTWTREDEEVAWDDVLQAGEQQLQVALELAADDRGRRGVVRSNPSTVRVKVGKD